MIVAYGIANLLQSMAAARTGREQRFHPSLLVKLAGHRVYLLGLGCQFGAFLLAFLARRELPLFLVQAAVAAGLGVTALLGVVVLKWRLPAAEGAVLGAPGVGLGRLLVAGAPAPAPAPGLLARGALRGVGGGGAPA